MIQAKVEGKEVVMAADDEVKPVVDIMTALRESIEAAKGDVKPMERSLGEEAGDDEAGADDVVQTDAIDDVAQRATQDHGQSSSLQSCRLWQTEKQPTQHPKGADCYDRVQQWPPQLEAEGGAFIVYVCKPHDIPEKGHRTVQRHRADNDHLGDLIERQSACHPPPCEAAAQGDQLSDFFSSAWLLHVIH